ncbi:hypothetical protein [Nonomuraea sp. LPB2021202275-12-8]|uniref:hypothetical protein n=1 Tax=Nonomuraea sp. LPB2021202275-12-8 TaxID=3120159 RepID=UPI00300C5F52
MNTQQRRRPSGPRRENGPIDPIWLRSSDLTPQHRHLVRNTMISASFDAWLRPNNTSQPNTRSMIR